MKPVDYFTRDAFINDDALFLEWLNKMFLMVSEEKEDLELFESNRTMQSQAYGAVTTQEVVDRQEHLNEEQKKHFKRVLDKHTVLFDGELGRYPHKKFDLELMEGTELKWQRPFPIPYRNKKLFADEIQEMINDGIIN